MLPDMSDLSEDDLVQLRLIYSGFGNTVMADDVARWRAGGWLEPEPSWKLTPQGLAAIDMSTLPVDRDIPLLKDPGPNHAEPPAIRHRSPAELQPVREALISLSSALLRLAHPVHRADGRLAWIHAILPLASPEEVGDAISFAGCVLRRMGEPDLWQNVTVEQEADVRRATLRSLSALGALVDDMREEADGPPTDRRRSVAADRWETVPIEEVDLLYEAAQSVVEFPLQSRIDRLAAVVARIREVFNAATASSAT